MRFKSKKQQKKFKKQKMVDKEFLFRNQDTEYGKWYDRDLHKIKRDFDQINKEDVPHDGL